MGRSRVRQQPRQPLTGDAPFGFQRPDPVDLGEKAPQRGVGVFGQRVQLVDGKDVPWLVTLPLVLAPIPRIPVDATGRVAMQGEEAFPAGVPAVLAQAQLEVPAVVAPADLAGLARPPCFEDALDDVARLLRRRLDVDAVASFAEECRARDVDGPFRLAAGRSVSEPAVDRILGGVEQRGDLAPFAHGVVLRERHPAHEPTPAVGGHDRDIRDRRRGNGRATGNRQLRGPGAERAADSAAVERRPHALEIPGGPDVVRQARDVGSNQEAGAHRLEVGGQLILTNTADLDGHGANIAPGQEPPRTGRQAEAGAAAHRIPGRRPGVALPESRIDPGARCRENGHSPTPRRAS